MDKLSTGGAKPMRVWPMMLALALGGCAGGNALEDARSEYRQSVAVVGQNILNPAREFEQEKPPKCSSAKLQQAVTLAKFSMGQVDPKTNGIDAVRTVAEASLDVADIAKRHGCKDAAREVYDAVMRTYVGASYAAYRERAALGVTELR